MCKRVFDETIKLKDNAMLKVRPELFYEWDFEKNDALGLDIYKVTKGIWREKAWWICEKGHTWDATIQNRTFHKSRCPFCSRLGASNENSLASKYPDLSLQWHPNLNGDLTPYDVTSRSAQRVWWLGECGHEWDSSIYSRSSGKTGCPYCSNVKFLVGVNDMWTTTPELASLLANPQDGYENMKSSKKRTDWKCPDCSSIIRNKSIINTNRNGFFCINCSDGKSYPEKFMYYYLQELNVCFDWEKSFSWSNGKRYDFYIENSNTIIEMHGSQHYDLGIGFESIGGRNLKEEVQNDKHKRSLAQANGVKNYIEINAATSDLEYLKESIIKSNLPWSVCCEKVDWLKIAKNAEKSIVKEAWDLWKKDNSINQISEELKMTTATIRNYLRRGDKLGVVQYPKEKEKRIDRAVAQLDYTFNLIKIWSSTLEAQTLSGFNERAIIRSCKNKLTYYKGFIWLYEDDYINNDYNKEEINYKKIRNQRIIQLSLSNETIRSWESIAVASKKLNMHQAGIRTCCQGKTKKAYGFKWMYKEDYDKLVTEQEESNLTAV